MRLEHLLSGVWTFEKISKRSLRNDKEIFLKVVVSKERLVSPSVSTLGFFIVKDIFTAQAASEAAFVRCMNKTNIT